MITRPPAKQAPRLSPAQALEVAKRLNPKLGQPVHFRAEGTVVQATASVLRQMTEAGVAVYRCDRDERGLRVTAVAAPE